MMGASEKVIGIMKKLPLINTRGGLTIPDDQIEGEIELKDVCFCYPTKPDVQVAKGINLKIA